MTKGKDYDALDALASAYAELSRFPEAAATERKAIEQAEGSAFADLQVLRHRLELYQAGKPCRE